jgi:hypothetical protein
MRTLRIRFGLAPKLLDKGVPAIVLSGRDLVEGLLSFAGLTAPCRSAVEYSATGGSDGIGKEGYSRRSVSVTFGRENRGRSEVLRCVRSHLECTHLHFGIMQVENSVENERFSANY